PNHPPTFTSLLPPDHAVQDDPYRYQFAATDADGDALRFALASVTPPLPPPPLPGEPDNGQIRVDPATGVLTWKPTVYQLGAQNIVVQVQDGQGGFVNLPFTITVVPPGPDDDVPTIVSTPA